MSALADVWPLLVVAGCGFLFYAVIRLARRFSPGSVSAGPKTPPDATHLGRSDLADDLRRIERRLDTRPASMIRRIEESCHELGVSTHVQPVGPTALEPQIHIDLLLERLETQLQLPPLADAPPLPTTPEIHQ